MTKQYIILDYDSTFIQVEALEVLIELASIDLPNKTAIMNQVQHITKQAMAGELSITDSLMQRTKLVPMTHRHILQAVAIIATKISLSIQNNLAFLREHAEHIYIVSNGFKELILPIVTRFGILPHHVFANDFTYNADCDIVGMNENNLLCNSQGKAAVIKNLNLNGKIHMIGDGYNDYEARLHGEADVFYLFVENIYRDEMVKYADHIIKNFDEFLSYNQFLPITKNHSPQQKVLLLENIHPQAITLFQNAGYIVEVCCDSMSENELCNKITDVTILGIRSKTIISAKVLSQAHKLLVIGAFCIGTNQIDLSAASKLGIAVFNAPYSNTRSVVELIIGEIIILLRRIIDKNNKLHHGVWDKSATASYEIRGKKLGIIGYGNIGAQLSVLAESLGMSVYYYDITDKLHLGNAQKCNTLDEILAISDIVTVHVDGRQSNQNLIGENEFQRMKHNVIFLNLSRGHVVDLKTLIKYINLGKIAGVGIDVFPDEPSSNKEKFASELCGLPNVILTPHIGGSTLEAQINIACFVANKIIDYINVGDSNNSVNLPNIQLPIVHKAHRIVHLHYNVPGIIASINQILSSANINILAQYLKTNDDIGYVITDIATDYNESVIQQLHHISSSIKLRILY